MAWSRADSPRQANRGWKIIKAQEASVADRLGGGLELSVK